MALAHIPTIALDYPNVEPALEATVQITTAIYGIHASGTAYRMDEIPLPLKAFMDSDYPTDADVLGQIEARVKERRAVRNRPRSTSLRPLLVKRAAK